MSASAKTGGVRASALPSARPGTPSAAPGGGGNGGGVGIATPLFVSISHHWDTPITYNSATKPAYEHILDIVAGVDIQTAQDRSTVIVTLTQDEVAYANSIGKPVHITIETYDVITHVDPSLNEWNTFFDEGEAVMKTELFAIDYATAKITGFAFHFYNQSMGSATTNWPE